MRILQRSTIEQPIVLGFGMTIVVLLIVGGIAWNNALQSTASLLLVEHTRDVMTGLDQVRSKMDQAENRQWAYFLTHDQNLLTQRDTALGELKTVLQSLTSATRYNSQQQKRLVELQTAIDQRIQLLIESQSMFDAQGFSAAQPIFNAGQAAVAAVHSITLDAAREEVQLLAQRKQSELRRANIIAASIVILMVILALAWMRIRQVIRNRLSDEKILLEQRKPLLKIGVLQDAMFNSPYFSCIATDNLGKIQIFNPGAERMLGYTAAEVLDIFTPADISDAHEMVARAAALSVELGVPISAGFEALVFKASRGIADMYELTYVRKDGSRFPAIVSVTSLRDAHDNLIGYLLIGTDNTVRKQVVDALQIANAKLEAWGQALNSFAIVAETDLQGKIIYANDPFCEVSQYSREELLGNDHKDLVGSGHHEKDFWKEMWSTIGHGQIWQGEICNHTKKGVVYWVDTIIVPMLAPNGKPESYLAFRFLITERKLLDQKLQDNYLELAQAKAAAEKANLAKSEFLSSMSHELRTPLNAVLGFAQLLTTANPPPTVEQQRSLDQILKGGWYLLHLINEILDLAIIESGKITISLESTSLYSVLQDCSAMLETQAHKREIQITLPSPVNPLYVLADRTRIKQVIINLLSNAIKYNRNGGAVIVHCTMQDAATVRMTVQDTGPGLSPEKIPQLFQPFNRLGQENKTQEGTGIGLVVAKQLVELMGGKIGVHSTVGTGSQFWIELPATHAPALVCAQTLQAATATATATATAYSLLYVEDNPANLALIEELVLRRDDIKLLTAVDGYTGIQMARIHKPDVILLDINLPGISGFGVLKILREDPATAHIPVMALSANAIPSDAEKGIEAGFYRYLTKPIHVDDFMHAIDAALEYKAKIYLLTEEAAT